ncbi:MAG: hypothetical protein ACYTDT_14250 [Planctomycetota bacterium]|jgi:hypothetical protein
MVNRKVLAALLVCLPLAVGCSNLEVPDLKTEVEREQIIPKDWHRMPLRVGLAPVRAVLELKESEYNVEDTQRWVLKPNDKQLNGDDGVYNKLFTVFKDYNTFESIERISGVTPESTPEEVRKAALAQGLDVIIYPEVKRRDVGYVDSNGSYGWNMFMWWMVTPIITWWVADEDFDANLHIDLHLTPAVRDTQLDRKRLQPEETVVRSFDDWDEGWSLFGIFSTPNGFDKENWNNIGNALLPIAEVEAQKAALRYAVGELNEKHTTNRFLSAIRRRVALVVGVDGTGQPPLPLSRYAVADAEAIAAHLLEAESNPIPDGAMRILTGTRASKSAVTTAARELSNLARYNDDVFLAFCGVGILNENRKPSLVLSKPPSAQKTEAIDLVAVVNQLLVNGPRTITIMLDTSFTAPGDKRCATIAEQLEGFEPSEGSSIFDGVIKACEDAGTRCIILSATDAQPAAEFPMRAIEMEDLKHGLFSNYALRGLSGGADANNDHAITVEELQSYLKEKVSHIASLEGETQEGWFHVDEKAKGYAMPGWSR